MTPYPQWPVLGMSPLDSCLPDVVADKLSARHEASILRNSGVSSVSVAPMLAKDGQPQPIFTTSQQAQLKMSIQDKISGDNKGAPMIWAEPVDIQQLGFDPKQLLCTEVRHMAEMRICAGFHVQPVVLGLGAGLEKSNNRASIEGAIDITLQTGILPYMRHRASQISEDLVPELGEPGQVVVYDESALPYLKDMLVRQITQFCGGPIYSINEGRAEVSLLPVPGGDIIRQASTETKEKNGESATSESKDDPI
jgi:phage portal protein BeeE